MMLFRRWVILIHRYLGIAVSLLFVMWFVSGVAMIFARGMPSLTTDVRFQRLPKIDFAKVNVTPSEAVEKAQLGRPPARATMLMVMGRPAYRFTNRGTVTVFADDGEVLETVGEREAISIARAFMSLPDAMLQYSGEQLEPDQWTLEERQLLPAHKVFVNDSAKTELYISESTAEVGLLTTRSTRALAYVAAIPHWMYFAPLRQNGPVWRQVVLWTSGVGVVLALLGIVLAFTQYRTQYAGLMRWHYLTGAVLGVFALTWVFSGLLSMEPFFWASGGETGSRIPQTLRGGPLDLSQFPKPSFSATGIKEVDFLRIQGDPYYLLRNGPSEPVLVSADSMQERRELFTPESLVDRIKQATPGETMIDSSLLTTYDGYYHPSERKPPLPVLRVKFADPNATWFYVDPRLSQVVASFTRRERLQRWIYHGLHSFDFNFWYYNGPVWRTVMVALNAGGAALSLIGVVIAIKRIKRAVKRGMRGKKPQTL